LACILGSHFLEGGADQLLVHGVAGHAVLGLGQSLISHGGSHSSSGQSESDQNLLHHEFPGQI
jgi:hypothetical protein